MKTQCPHCKARFNAPDQAAGKSAKCPKCHQQFTIKPFDQALPQELCTSCKATIGPQEQAYIYKGNVVCEKCYNKFKTAEQEPPSRDATAAKKLKSENLLKAFYVYCWAAIRIVAGIVCVLGLALAIKAKAHSILRATFVAGGIFVVGSALIELALYYKMYSAIYDDKATTSPVKAVAFLFIPLFNIYWALYMLVGFAEDYNEFIRRHSIKTKTLPPTLFLIYAAAFVLSSITVTVPMAVMFAFVRLIKKAFIAYTSFSWLLFFLVIFASISHFIVYIIFATKTCNAINALDLPSASEMSSNSDEPKTKFKTELL